jgi:hypothetical protein
MAVVALAAGRIAAMMRVLHQVVIAEQFMMALQTGSITFRRCSQLVIGPLVDGAVVVQLLMHLMAAQAREFAALEATRFEQPVVFAAGDPDHAVRPEVIIDK